MAASLIPASLGVKGAIIMLLILGLWAVLDFICQMKDKQDHEYNQRQIDEAYRKMEEQYGQQNRG
jgi:hypothetical protein